MKKYIIVIFVSLSLVASSQTTEHIPRIELGIDMVGLTNRVTPITLGNSFFGTQYLKPFIFKYHMKNSAFYSTFNFTRRFENARPVNYWYRKVLLSLGLQKDYFYNKVNFFYGAALSGYYSDYYPILTDSDTMSYYYQIIDEFGVGLNTFVGFNLFVTDYISVSSEIDFSLERFWRKSLEVKSTPQILVYTGFIYPGTTHLKLTPIAYISVNIHLFKFKK